MEELAGRVAVVTGGGSGIGRALALGLAGEGMDVVVADIETAAAEAVAAEVEAAGRRSLPVTTDVADPASVDALAETSCGTFGEVHVVCNNAGVLIMAPMLDGTLDDWSWVLGVNVLGVVHGIRSFVPRLRAQGGPAHIVNTSSVAALAGGASSGIYAMSKAAVLSITESLRAELAPHAIGVTALCPGNISSRILGAQRNRPDRFGDLADEPFGRDLVDFGTDPSHAARRTIEAIKADEPYAFAYPGAWGADIGERAHERHARIEDAIARGAVPDQ